MIDEIRRQADVIIYLEFRCPKEWVSFTTTGKQIRIYAIDGSLCAARGWDAIPEYTSDPSAWDQELFALIEERGIHGRFTVKVMEISMLEGNHMIPGWALVQATPPHKATALARAIEEAQ